MLEKSRHDLEYDKVLHLLEGMAVSPLGKKKCAALRPHSSFDDVLMAQGETDDFLQEILKNGEFPLSSFDDISEILYLVNIGSTASLSDLLRVARQLRLVLRLKERLRVLDKLTSEVPLPRCLTLIQEMDPLRYLEQRIDECILSDEEVKDRATPELYAIRRQIQSYQEEVHRQLNKILRNYADILQEQLITVRGDRYVIPVKAEHKNRIQGLIHDSSSSGATVFIEPMLVVQLNNKIREAKIEESREIVRILKELSALVLGEKERLSNNQKCLTHLDFGQAKAKLAMKLDCRRPEMNDRGVITLKQARHPLIDQDIVVPIDFELGKEFTSLVITGPNTGGKTVSLKTCGLLTLMAMSGLQVPAKAGSELSFFKQVLADIGDEQSIEQSLSTFSAHMKQIIKICEAAGPGTLVIADELGAGTDPSEGAALAIAILDYLKKQGAHVVASTHYQELKGYAMNTAGVSNASCEFDNISMKPTYKLLIGVPGVSNAITISSRLGLKDEIITAAKALISDEKVQFQSLIEAIEQSHIKSKQMEEDIEVLHAEAEAHKRENVMIREKLKAERKKMVNEAREEAYRILLEAERLAEEELKSIRNIGLSVQESEEGKQRIKEKREAIQEAMGKERLRAGIDRPLSREELSEGEEYEDVLSGFSGQLTEMPDNKDQVLLSRGNISLRVPLLNLRLLDKDKEKGKREREKRQFSSRRSSGKVARDTHSAFLHTKSELYLLGMRVNDALQEVDSYLDNASLAGLETVRIVHGKGTGALRTAVREKLAKDKRVQSFADAAFGAGDAGVTVVTLA